MNKLKTIVTSSLVLILVLSIFGQVVKAETYYSQDITCYISEAGKSFASGITPYSGGIAVHPNHFYVNDWNDPIYNFGTLIISRRAIEVPWPGYSYPEYPRYMQYFYVQDTGELNNQNNFTSKWFDIWVGTYPKRTRKQDSPLYRDCLTFGIQKANYDVFRK